MSPRVCSGVNKSSEKSLEIKLSKQHINGGGSSASGGLAEEEKGGA